MFFGDLTTLRSTGTVDSGRIDEARRATKGGTPVSDLRGLTSFMERSFPDLGYFDCALTSGDFPKNIAAFLISVTDSWTKVNQHGVFVVYGHFVLERVRKAKETLTRDKFRDEFAGGCQHYANGLMHAAMCAFERNMVDVSFPCFDAPRTPLQMIHEAIRSQRTACSLRAEKYATPGGSKSHFFSFKSALENLATAIEFLSKIDPTDTAKSDQIAASLRAKAAGLALGKEEIFGMCSEGAPLTEEVQKAIARDRRAAASVAAVLPAVQVTIAETCSSCSKKPPTYRGFSCRCLCLCDDCIEPDILLECPGCGEFTEFVRA